MASLGLAPVPPSEVLRQMLPDELEACLEAWLLLAQYHLSIPDEEFGLQETSLAAFLTSYFSRISSSLGPDPVRTRLRDFLPLKRQSFLLVHRILSRKQIPKALLEWDFLSDVCHEFLGNQGLRDLLQSVWSRERAVVESSLETAKRSAIASNGQGSDDSSGLSHFLKRLAPLVQVLPEAGETVLTGSDLLDEMILRFPEASPETKKSCVIITYLGFVALLRKDLPNSSLIHDQLYALKTDGEKRGFDSLISSIVSNTPLLARFNMLNPTSKPQRLQEVAKSLHNFRQAKLVDPLRRTKRKKGKSVAIDGQAHGLHDMHLHRMSLISQMQDLFPDLGSGFIARLLTYYNNDTERATSHLLEGCLPEDLSNADRKEALPLTEATHNHVEISPSPTPPLERRNKFDNDELDRLAVDTSKIHIGKRDTAVNEDVSSKAAIMSALAAFDSDDDERDDTYDLEDVGGTVDTAVAEADQVRADDKSEEALFRAFKLDPKLFERDATTRRSQPRLLLRRETGLTDEAIEGWLVMNSRDPRRLRRLETKYDTWTGQQQDLAATSWRQSSAADVEYLEGSGPNNRHGGPTRASHGPSRSGGHRGRGNVANPASDANTQHARQRKEAHKGSRANHNRRDQRARKMARGGFGA